MAKFSVTYTIFLAEGVKQPTLTDTIECASDEHEAIEQAVIAHCKDELIGTPFENCVPTVRILLIKDL